MIWTSWTHTEKNETEQIQTGEYYGFNNTGPWFSYGYFRNVFRKPWVYIQRMLDVGCAVFFSAELFVFFFCNQNNILVLFQKLYEHLFREHKLSSWNVPGNNR